MGKTNAIRPQTGEQVKSDPTQTPRKSFDIPSEYKALLLSMTIRGLQTTPQEEHPGDYWDLLDELATDVYDDMLEMAECIVRQSAAIAKTARAA